MEFLVAAPKASFPGDDDGSYDDADDGGKIVARERGNCIEPLRGAQVPQGPKI